VASLRALQAGFSSQMHVETDFTEPLAHKIYGGCDIFLMPSTYEPCGLGQLIAMRYGAVPVVTPTGGLLDTVVDARKNSKGTGFVAANMTVDAVREAVFAAMDRMKNVKAWGSLQKRAMTADHSWSSSMKAYVSLYESVRSPRKKH
jgi:starch synthase